MIHCKKLYHHFYFIFVIVIIFSVSYISRSPFYGKLKFLVLNTFYTNFEYAELLAVNAIRINKKTFIKSDPITEYTLHSMFGNPTERKLRELEPFSDIHIAIQSINPLYYSANSACLINLKGFPDTWVPHLTGHWDPIISNTSRFYEHNGYRGKKLAITIENEFKNECIVLKDKETPWKDNENFRYLSPNLNYTGQQEDIHILQFWNDRAKRKYNILIDAGWIDQARDKLLDYLAVNEIYHIDEIYISHPHKDHYSGLYELVQFGIPIRKVWMNMPHKEYCDREIPWGCDYPDLVRLLKLLNDKKIAYEEITHTNPDDPKVLYQDEHNRLSMLFASPANNPQEGNVDINDLSMLLKLETNGTTYLFTGDLNNSLSNYLKDNPAFQADILKVPHHGTEGVASNEFFERVGAKVGIVPSPQHLWCSERSSRIHNYFLEKKTEMYISGFHGDITIRHFEDGSYKIKTEHSPEEVCGIHQGWWARIKGKF